MTNQDFITEPQRQPPIVAEVDVAVIGGGTAGIMAAGGAVGPKEIDPPPGNQWHIGRSRPVVHYEAVKTLAETVSSGYDEIVS